MDILRPAALPRRGFLLHSWNGPMELVPELAQLGAYFSFSAHHLIPRSKGGKETQYLHRICHRQIHALFTETELARRLNSADAIREHPQMQRFIEWVKNKPDGFYERVAKSTRLKER